MCVSSVCVWQWQGWVWSQGGFGRQRVLPAELLRRVGVQSSEQSGGCCGHSDGQVSGGQRQTLREGVAQVHRLLVL